MRGADQRSPGGSCPAAPLVAAALCWVAAARLCGGADEPPSVGAAVADGSVPTAADATIKRWLYEQHALTNSGDAARGRALFLDQQRTRCAVCHKVAGQGGTVGPDLSAIAGKFDRPHLIESLLEPSRQIVEGYRTSTIVTVDGRVATGIVRRQSPGAITLVDAAGKEQEIAAGRIEQQHESPLSLMPDGLAEALSAAEFTDLVAYLETLRPGGKLTPGEAIAGRIELANGFHVQTVATAISGATALETTVDGRVFVCEQRGALRVVRNGRLLAEPFATLAVDGTWERGLLGVTVDPQFPDVPHVYVCYVAARPYPHHRVSRLTAQGDTALPESEQILFAGDDQSTLGGSVPAGHQGGALHFGPDGKLYVAIGDQTAGTPAQDLASLLGKILRLNPDGTIPQDNPLLDQTSGKYRAIWARGLRNPFTFAVHPAGGELLINDVGGRFEEINRGVPGGNYGWPVVEHGASGDQGFIGPIHQYPQASIAGADFAPPALPWPATYRGRYFFADFVHGWIKSLDPDRPQRVETFATGLRRPVDLRFGRDGNLYVLVRNAWVIDGKFQPHTGSLLQIRYIGATSPRAGR